MSIVTSTPFVTTGSTPLCDACHQYYSERRCVDCDEYQCTWCAIARHEPIGARNHERPRLYGHDAYENVEPTPGQTPTTYGEQHPSKAQQSKSSTSSSRPTSSSLASSFSGTTQLGRIPFEYDATTSKLTLRPSWLLVGVSAAEAWNVLGGWDMPFLQSGSQSSIEVETNSTEDERTIKYDANSDGEGDEEDGKVSMVEHLVDRNESEHRYSYMTTTPSSWSGCPFADMSCDFAIHSPSTSKSDSYTEVIGGEVADSDNGPSCQLDLTSRVSIRKECRSKSQISHAAEHVAQHGLRLKPFVEAAIVAAQ